MKVRTIEMQKYSEEEAQSKNEDEGSSRSVIGNAINLNKVQSHQDNEITNLNHK